MKAENYEGQKYYVVIGTHGFLFACLGEWASGQGSGETISLYPEN